MPVRQLTWWVPLIFLLSCQPTEPSRGVQLEGDSLEPGDFGTYRALIIGINDYEYWPLLQFAESDAMEIREILASDYGFDPANVALLVGSEATESKIFTTLKNIVGESTEKDNLLVYYAGHGQLDPLTQTGHWIPADGDLYDESGWISFSVIRNLITSDNVKAKSILVITDSCYGGALARSGPTPGKLSPQDPGYIRSLVNVADERSRLVIASGGFEQVPTGAILPNC